MSKKKYIFAVILTILIFLAGYLIIGRYYNTNPISEEEACSLAYDYFSTVEEDITSQTVTLDTNGTEKIYTIEFSTKENDYKVKINATNGKIIKTESKH